MVTNQDGLGTTSLPREKFDRAHRFILDLFASQGIEFDAVFICPHFKHEDCGCRKPKLGMVRQYLDAHPLDAARSYMIGDRDTDLEFAANLGIQGLRVRLARGRAGDLARHRPAHPRRRSPRAGAAQDQGNGGRDRG